MRTIAPPPIVIPELREIKRRSPQAASDAVQLKRQVRQIWCAAIATAVIVAVHLCITVGIFVFQEYRWLRIGQAMHEAGVELQENLQSLEDF